MRATKTLVVLLACVALAVAAPAAAQTSGGAGVTASVVNVGMTVTNTPTTAASGVAEVALQSADALPVGASAGLSALPASTAADVAAGATVTASGASEFVGAVMQPAAGVTTGSTTSTNQPTTQCTSDDCMKEAIVVGDMSKVKTDWQRARLYDHNDALQLDPSLRDETKVGETIYDKNDTELTKLHAALEEIKTQMLNDRRWVSDVHNIMRHYRQKVGQVELGLRSKATQALRIKGLIASRHKANARLALQDKLKRVTDALSKLQQQADTVQGKTSSLENVKNDLRSNIVNINRQLQSLRFKANSEYLPQ